MIRKRYKNFNDPRDRDRTLNLCFLVHPSYYTVLELEEEDLVKDEIRNNFLQVVRKINLYEKTEPKKNYKKTDNLARELNSLRSWELLKHTYKYRIPILFQNVEKFNLHENEMINYFSINYYAKKRNLVRNKIMATISKDKCFIIDTDMIYSMTPEYISTKIGDSIVSVRKEEFKRKQRGRRDGSLPLCKRKRRCYNENVLVKEDTGEDGSSGELLHGGKESEQAEVVEMNKVGEKEEAMATQEEPGGKIPLRTPNPTNKGDSDQVLTYLDPFCGAGGNSLSMSHFFTISADIDLKRVKECQHNCKFYNNNVDFIVCDFFNIVNLFRENTIDVVFLSIPWGGPSYKKEKNFKLDYRGEKLTVYSCLRESMKLTRNVIFYLPRNVRMVDLYELFCYYEKLTNGKNKLKEQGISNELLIELYSNRVRCVVDEQKDNSIQNFHYFFNKQTDMPSNEFDIEKQRKLFSINIDECNQFLNIPQVKKNKRTTGHLEEIYEINVDGERNSEGDTNSGCTNSGGANDERNASVEKTRSGNMTDRRAHRARKEKPVSLWKWHNTCMVVYLGKIAKVLKKKKTINYNNIYYLHKELSKCNMEKVRNKGETNFSLYRYLCNKKKMVIQNITRKVEKREICESKNEKTYNILFNHRNVFFLNYFMDKKLNELMSNIFGLFFKNVKNIMGFEKVSFLNKVFINVDNTVFNALTRKLTMGHNIKKYETYIYSDMLNKSCGLYIITDYFNMIFSEIKKVMIILFGIYLHDITFMKYFFKFYKVKVSITKLINKKSLKNIHYMIIRLMFKFILYINLFKNILSNNIKLEEFFNKNIVNTGLENLLEYLDIANNDYNFIKQKNKKDFSFSFKNLMKKIITLSVSMEINGRAILTEKVTNLYFGFLFNGYDPDDLLHALHSSLSEGEEEEQVKYYRWHMCLSTVNFFTKQFFYNTNITSFLDYFNSLIYFYFNQMYVLCKCHPNYSNFFIAHLNNFLYDNFCVKIL
ncbi:trimethylguanosine synthase, putative [Plasmodium knowlesi strain H]|uniref:Trimethylguanosine synthase n=3 Tax=Plasmodium knowlesi TaxID=5850 RepID=A0A5K1TWC8_PLAKH|nr:trimethylguanosine synthase, putative [Plasmodium knowlesi strain H]OTN66772.1 putative Trimethylguanosine synthase [Plasmodium knowlesi]CAA9990064.1 trimethylguanosine synthase, putative [Plasmodium knowlesi strain H]SBO25724.1 trimethylguanosine synthase, putative [Plasmodium knowlesi strain H]SBO28536.1 trimethylguanosine synthase, putative [Plasmodium knowlesi strain H]VVS79538.1 trimethylguanosine synthase, putative [Plasmodium knowlesi strain H]|eukprot:XP_002260531.1 hypothetical protein, conserved in Plasmodium species [Plasmodium knowlesi strain H]